MHQQTAQPPRMKRWVVAWMSLATLVLLVIGLYIQAPIWMVALWVVIPLVLGLLLLILSARTTTAPDGAYGITSHSARSEGQLAVGASVEQVVRVLPRVIDRLPRFSLVELTEAGAELTAKGNMKTWGERIMLELHPASPTSTEIRARCEPTVATTLIDYGQGAADLRALLGALEEHTGEDGHSLFEDERPAAPSSEAPARPQAAMSRTGKITQLVVSYLAFLALCGVVGYFLLGESVWLPLVVSFGGFLVAVAVTVSQQRKRTNGR
jgi:hypothetical protein